MLWSSPLFWIAFAVFLFWALGAYNRLMRLRSAVVQSFGSFDAHMVRLVALLGEFGAAQTVQRGSSLADAGAQELAALQGDFAHAGLCDRKACGRVAHQFFGLAGHGAGLDGQGA